MSDAYKVSAPARDKRGNDGVFSITVRERDSEVIPEEEKRVMLMLAASRKGIDLVGTITIEAGE